MVPIAVTVPDRTPGMPRVPRRVIVPAMVVAVPPASRLGLRRDECDTSKNATSPPAIIFMESKSPKPEIDPSWTPTDQGKSLVARGCRRSRLRWRSGSHRPELRQNATERADALQEGVAIGLNRLRQQVEEREHLLVRQVELHRPDLSVKTTRSTKPPSAR